MLVAGKAHPSIYLAETRKTTRATPCANLEIKSRSLRCATFLKAAVGTRTAQRLIAIWLPKTSSCRVTLCMIWIRVVNAGTRERKRLLTQLIGVEATLPRPKTLVV